MKKLFYFFTAVILGISLVSCGDDIQKVEYEIPDQLTEDQITITFWHQMGADNQGVLDEMIANFNIEYPNIKINHTSQSNYDTLRDKILNSFGVNEQPNMAFCYSDHVAAYREANAVITIDEFMNHPTWGLSGNDSKDDIIQGFLDEGRVFGDGLTYTMPFAKSTEVIYYNKSLFEKHNLKVPTTWDEFETVAAAIKKIDSTYMPLGYDSESNLFITMLLQNNLKFTSVNSKGEGSLDFNNPAAISLIEKLKTWNTNGWLYNGSFFGADVYTSDQLKDRKMWMSIGSTGGARYNIPTKVTLSDYQKEVVEGNALDYAMTEAQFNEIKGKPIYPFETGVAPIPQQSEDSKAVIQQGPNITLFYDENPQEMLASWLFLKFITNTENSARYAVATGYSPIRESSFETAAMKSYLEKANITNLSDYEDATIKARALVTARAQNDSYYTTPAFVGSTEARTQVGYIITQSFTGAKTVQKAFEDAIKEIEFKMGY